jgi:hypothetical protein
MRADKYSTEPRSQVFAPLKIMHAKGGSSKKLSIRVRHPRDRLERAEKSWQVNTTLDKWADESLT